MFFIAENFTLGVLHILGMESAKCPVNQTVLPGITFAQ